MAPGRQFLRLNALCRIRRIGTDRAEVSRKMACIWLWRISLHFSVDVLSYYMYGDDRFRRGWLFFDCRP